MSKLKGKLESLVDGIKSKIPAGGKSAGNDREGYAASDDKTGEVDASEIFDLDEDTQVSESEEAIEDEDTEVHGLDEEGDEEEAAKKKRSLLIKVGAIVVLVVLGAPELMKMSEEKPPPPVVVKKPKRKKAPKPDKALESQKTAPVVAEVKDKIPPELPKTEVSPPAPPKEPPSVAEATPSPKVEPTTPPAVTTTPQVPPPSPVPAKAAAGIPPETPAEPLKVEEKGTQKNPPEKVKEVSVSSGLAVEPPGDTDPSPSDKANVGESQTEDSKDSPKVPDQEVGEADRLEAEKTPNLAEALMDKVDGKKIEYTGSPNYERLGRGLVYNCVGKHWACVDKFSYFKCRENYVWAKQNNKSHECVVRNVYASVEDCGIIQEHKINTLADTGFCKVSLDKGNSAQDTGLQTPKEK